MNRGHQHNLSLLEEHDNTEIEKITKHKIITAHVNFTTRFPVGSKTGIIQDS